MSEKVNPASVPALIEASKSKFELACKNAEVLQIVNNFGAAFDAVNVVKLLREALTDEIMKEVFLPLMNTKIGFLTDRSGKPNSRGEVKPLYSIAVVRDAIIDGVSIGLLPTGNQMNIIAERMYPTKEGYTTLLSKVGVKYFLEIGYDKGTATGFGEIPVKINFEYKGEKKTFQITATVKKDMYASADALRGKAERRAKKTLYEYLTGCDFGETDIDESEVISSKINSNKTDIMAQNITKTTETVNAKTSTEIPANENFDKNTEPIPNANETPDIKTNQPPLEMETVSQGNKKGKGKSANQGKIFSDNE